MSLFHGRWRKKLLELAMAASDENPLGLDNLIDKENLFDNLVNEISKKTREK